MHKIKIIGSKCELIAPDQSKQKFSDLYDLVFYCRNHKIKISNPGELPDSFQELLNDR